MEKFAVDLDKVLDEFEYNEDLAERRLKLNKSNKKLLDINVQNNYIPEKPLAPLLADNSTTEIVADKPNTILLRHDTNIISENVLPNPKLDYKSNKSDSLYWQGGGVFKNENSEQHVTGQKLNVSGVFSSLNEYLNAGSASLLSESDCKTKATVSLDPNLTENIYKKALDTKNCNNKLAAEQDLHSDNSNVILINNNLTSSEIHSKKEEHVGQELQDHVKFTMTDIPSISSDTGNNFNNNRNDVDMRNVNSENYNSAASILEKTGSNMPVKNIFRTSFGTCTEIDRNAEYVYSNWPQIKDDGVSFREPICKPLCNDNPNTNKNIESDVSLTKNISTIYEGSDENTDISSDTIQNVCDPISFNYDEEISDSELELYLEQLESTEELNAEADIPNQYPVHYDGTDDVKHCIAPTIKSFHHVSAPEDNKLVEDGKRLLSFELEKGNHSSRSEPGETEALCSSDTTVEKPLISGNMEGTFENTRIICSDVNGSVHNTVSKDTQTEKSDEELNSASHGQKSELTADDGIQSMIKEFSETGHLKESTKFYEAEKPTLLDNSVTLLHTNETTSNVTSVVSIECQQLKLLNNRESTVDVQNYDPLIAGEYSELIQSKVIAFQDNHTLLNSQVPVINEETSKQIKSCELMQEQQKVENNVTVLVPENSEKRQSTENSVIILAKESDQEDKRSRPNTLKLLSKITVTNDDHSLEHHINTGGNHEGQETQILDSQDSHHDLSPAIAINQENVECISPDISESSVELPISPSAYTYTVSHSDGLSPEERNLGKSPPFWVPDADAPNCMQCEVKFTVLKRRHHCRACGKVLCSKCCASKHKLDYLDNTEARVCQICFGILTREFKSNNQVEGSPGSPISPNNGLNTTGSHTPLRRQPNPNNPMEYCSTIPPLEQAASSLQQPLPSVLVPVGVLKREGSTKTKSDVAKQVMFSDGIRPGGDLTELDGSSINRTYKRQDRKGGGTPPGVSTFNSGQHALSPTFDSNSKGFISSYAGLPPLASLSKGDLTLAEVDNDKIMKVVRDETSPPVMFALNRNLFLYVKILNLDCCVNRICWCFSTSGMSSVGQDEIVFILECLPEEPTIPRDVFCQIYNIYLEASRGRMVSGLGHTLFQGSFLGSSDHGGFIYVRPSFQCLHKLILPPAPYLIAILIHRWETPWAKVFPIRLMLRLGAEFRYYPCMLVSIRDRKPVYCEIGHTIIKLLADFRHLSYTLPQVRGMVIHMEDRHTSILLPRNRYDQVMQALNNSNDHVLALAANFSHAADSHLVCIQSSSDESYHTQAINIHNKPRKVTGASFVVFNGALKISSNLSAKSSIVEDGLMVQITPDTIQELRASLRNMKEFSVCCGPAGAEQPDERVFIKWIDDDKNFNIGVRSFIDGRPLDGAPSIRVHNGRDFMGTRRFIRWTEVFILQSEDVNERGNDPLDLSRLSESIARATCLALVDLLDLLAQAELTKIGIRATIHPENVGYEAGGRGEKLPPIYMNSLDNELVPVLHKAASGSPGNATIVLELIFHIMLQ